MATKETSMEKWQTLMTYRSNNGLSNNNGYYDEEKAYGIALYWSRFDWGGRELSKEDIEANYFATFGRLPDKETHTVSNYKDGI